MDTSFKHYVINEISKLPFYKVSSNGISHTIKCPYCNDDSPSHGHFCLKIDVDSDEPILYNCLKCPAGGVLTTDVLNQLGILVDSSMSANINKANRRYAKKNKLTDMTIEDFVIPPVIDDIDTVAKLNYINSRLGTKLDESSLVKYRIVTKLSEFLTFNKIDFDSVNGLNPNRLKFIDNNYVGFLSMNRNHIIFRKITDNPYGRRYDKVVINSRNIDPNSFYSIPSGFDIMYTGPMDIHIAEGPFDILSIYENLHNGASKQNELFYSVCGFGYSGVIKNLIRIGINTELNLHIYADNDKTDREILGMIKKNRSIVPSIKSICIHRNKSMNQKDYGVSKDFITDNSKKYQL